MTRVTVPPRPESTYDVTDCALDTLFAGATPSDAIISDQNVIDAYPWAVNQFSITHVVAPGEASKSVESYSKLMESLAAQGFKRGGRIYAFGGGVVGDLAGFAAATFARGVPYVQVPTSLLAMVDSSVGGKTGIDLGGKNMTGAFHFPQEVRLCTDLLKTLPSIEYVNGMAEVCKYGFILDADLVGQLSMQTISPESPSLKKMIAHCIELKRQVVEEDPFETTGRRAVLNFGHTIGHALEETSGYTMKHGHAVAIGMVAETEIAVRLGIADTGLAQSMRDVLVQQGLPTRPSGPVDLDEVLAAAAKDKKNGNQGIACSLVTQLGQCKLHRDIQPGLVRSTLAEIWL